MAQARTKQHRTMLPGWRECLRPGHLTGDRDQTFEVWNQQYGPGNWVILWRSPAGKLLNFNQIFWSVYVTGYSDYFAAHPEEAELLAAEYSYAYDRTKIPKLLAFDPYALYQIPGLPNQFHHVALNIAVTKQTGGFRGTTPLAVRGPHTPGHQWSPGYVPARQEYVLPQRSQLHGWWQMDTVESYYQSAKFLFVRV